MLNKLLFLLKKRKALALLIGAVVIIIFLFKFVINAGKTQQETYQTQTAERGTLVSSISGSGQVSTANSLSVNTQATGVVKKVYVINGQIVKSGDPLVELDLDRNSNQKYLAALASYQSAKNSINSAQATQYGLQSDMFANWKTYMDIAQNSTYQKSDGSPNETNRTLPEFHIAQDDWLSSEAKYKNQQAIIAQAQTSLSSSWITYQEASPIIYSPISGKVTGLSLQVGSIIGAQSQSSTTSTTSSQSQKIAVIATDAPPTVTINASEIDIPKIKSGNRVTITLDALVGKTYTGKVYSIDSSGEVNSGVTTYPVVIALDSASTEIFSNMSATANIIVQTKDNILVVPSSAVQTQNGQPTVRVKKNNQVTSIPVETGISSDTETEIISGLTEGDEVVTGSSTVNQQGATTRSPFSGSTFGVGTGGFGGGGGIRTGGGRN